MLRFLNGTIDDVLTLSVGKGIGLMKWYVDVSFGVHPDFKSHTGAGLTFEGGKGMPLPMSSKQKLMTSSSTTSELVGADDALPMIEWAPQFLEAQGYPVIKNVVYQDNKSAMLLEKNGKRSSGKRTRAINIRYFTITDLVERGKLTIEYCPTDEMIADYMSKGLQGIKFKKFREQIMGFKKIEDPSTKVKS